MIICTLLVSMYYVSTSRAIWLVFYHLSIALASCGSHFGNVLGSSQLQEIFLTALKSNAYPSSLDCFESTRQYLIDSNWTVNDAKPWDFDYPQFNDCMHNDMGIYIVWFIGFLILLQFLWEPPCVHCTLGERTIINFTNSWERPAARVHSRDSLPESFKHVLMIFASFPILWDFGPSLSDAVTWGHSPLWMPYIGAFLRLVPVMTRKIYILYIYIFFFLFSFGWHTVSVTTQPGLGVVVAPNLCVASFILQ